MSWVSPNGYSDPSSDWNYEFRAYDDDEGTFAHCGSNATEWRDFVEFNLPSSIDSDKLRCYLTQTGGWTIVDIDVYKDGAWVNVFQGLPTWGQYVEYSYSLGSVSKLRIRGYHTGGDLRHLQVHEVDVWEVALVGGVTKKMFMVMTF